MSLVMVGLSHKSAPVELREKLSFPEGPQLYAALKTLYQCENISELVVLSTCNRTEIYANVSHRKGGVECIEKFLSQQINQEVTTLEPYLYTRPSRDMVRHLFEVVSSLDSMVLGESEILGQVKRAYQAAEKVGTTKTLFNQLFRNALELGKRVRTDTEIGKHPVSIASAVLALAESRVGSLADCSLAILGAGTMAKLAATHLQDKDTKRVVIVSKTPEHAQDLAQAYGHEAQPLENLTQVLSEVDVLLSFTSAESYVIDRPLAQHVMEQRNGKPLLILDGAMPRDVDPRVNKIAGIELFDIDDVTTVSQKGYELRKQEISRVQDLVDEEVASFDYWLQMQEVVPTIQQMRFKAELIRDRELERASKHLTNLSPREKQAVEAMANAIITKMLHGPFARLRREAATPQAYVYTESLRFLFGLDTYPTGDLPFEKREAMRKAKRERLEHEKNERNQTHE